MRTKSARPSLLVRLVLIAFIILPVCATSYAQDDRRDFWVHNSTGRRITELYVSPHEREDWGGDILKNDLPNGSNTAVYFEAVGRTSCKMDFRLVFGDGSEQTYEAGTNTCVISTVTFHPRSLTTD